MLVQLNKIRKNFGGLPLFDNISLSISDNQRIGLVGNNGTGKTTLLKLLSGQEHPEFGTVSKNKGVKVGYLEQNPIISEDAVFKHIIENFEQISKQKRELSRVERMMADPETYDDKLLAYYGRLQEEFEKQGGYEIEDRVISVLKGLGLGDKLEQSLDSLSGGERVRVELVKLLVSDSDLLLLDEPTNHLDLAGISWLENFLNNSKKAVIVVSHDREFLDNVTQRTIEIEDSKLIDYPGNYSIYQKLKKERIKQMQKDFDLQQAELARLRKLARQYRQWGNESGEEKFYKKAKEIEHRIERMTILKAPETTKKRVRVDISTTIKASKELVKVNDLCKIMGEKILFEDSDFIIFKGERIAVMGENGSGKSTLLKIILGQISPDQGNVKISDSVQIGYLPQVIKFDKENQRIIEYTKDITGNEERARRELAKFGFYAGDVSKRLKDLSGGEKVRLYLLKIFQNEINLLIMDEPTNHLDIFAREEVENILANYQGTLLAVSHDRYFLKKNFDKTLLVDDGKIEKFDRLLIE
ncbi:ABC transporter [Floricoccus tropicus]|uniref:ABC transporter n=1 Tax=Floricoccus tropicus TaxID=1859473 RepID=A0A1E8GPB1_9LACT|nr:ABC-F family ATP-binding cassette domain-containing protein [Floricoccus tropicus]OFI50037.1 ABC transporter [Floricoccus tropicus]